MRVQNIDTTKVQAGFKQLLEGLGLDLEAEHFRETPERAMRAWTQELCSGLGEKSFELKTFEAVSETNDSISLINLVPP